MGAMTESEIATKIIEAASAGYITTASLAAGLRISRDQVIASYDVIQAAGYNLMRVPGSGGGVKIISKPRRSRRHMLKAA